MASLFNLCLILFLLILFNLTDEQTLDESDYDIYGQRLAVNEYFAVLAVNDQNQFQVYYPPYGSNTCTRVIPYSYSEQYVYNVAIGSKQNSSQLYFSYIAEYINYTISSSSVQSYLGFYSISPCNGSPILSPIELLLNPGYEDGYVLGMDPYGFVVYAINPIYVVYYQINVGIFNQWTINYSYPWEFSPRSIIIDQNETIHMVGYFCASQIICDINIIKMWKDSILNKILYQTQIIDIGEDLDGALFTSYTPTTDMSLTINNDLKLFVVGIPYRDTIFIYNYSLNGSIFPYNYIGMYTYNQSGIGFGKSLAWLDNNTIAILAYSLSTFPWSASQIQIHHLDNLLQVNGTIPQPYSAYPNNQQVLIGTKLNPLPKILLMMISWSLNSLAILCGTGDVLIVPMSSPGLCSSKISTLKFPLKLSIYSEDICIPGTEKSDFGWGPCLICPPNTKNNGSFGIQCENCLNNSFCPLGSTNDIIDDSTTSYEQADPYPESPELSTYEDILIHRIFAFGTTTRCLANSPLFWACVVFGFVTLVMIIMGILRFCPKREKHRQVIKNTFSRLDLIGEGELWIGGLLSLVLVVIICFAYVFSSIFVKLYPIEQMNDYGSSVSCDSSLINAQFSTSLELLSIKKLDNEKKIFDMLDSQPLNLTIELVNTGYNCNNLLMERDTGTTSPSVSWTSFNCSIKSNNATVVISTILTDHNINLQYNLTGPYFIGGIRICFSSDSFIDDPFTLQQLDFCLFSSTINNTLGSSPYISVDITKIINHTVSLYPDKSDEYTGRWIPNVSIQPLSDVLLYEDSGDYIRYLNYQTILVINIEETKYYVRNTQQPIIKQDEIIFQAILFTILCMEVFGLFFLIMKLAIVPIIQAIQYRLLKIRNKVDIIHTNTKENENKMDTDSFKLETNVVNDQSSTKMMINSVYNPRIRSV